MRPRLMLLLVTLAAATSGFAKDVYLSVGGSVGVFRTDARIINTSFDKDITIVARYLPTGNTDNTSVGTTTITVGKRSMAVYDDVVQSLFGGGPPLGAVRLTSDDDFVATQRIYALSTCNGSPCTLGQFVPGLEVTAAKLKGVLPGLKASSSFRTNIGVVNPGATAAKVTWKLYDKQNALVATGPEITMPPFAVIAPTSIASGFFFNAGTADLSDAWVSYVSDKPIFAYGSVVDNGSTDPTFVPAFEDTGVPPTVTPTVKIVTVTARDFTFTVTKPANLKQGDTVKFVISATNGAHGFNFSTPNGTPLIDINTPLTSTPIEQTVVLPATGTYFYFCTLTSCGTGHLSMNGDMVVGEPSEDDGEKY